LQSYNEDAQDKAGRLEQQVAALTAENASLRQRLPAHSAIHGAYIADLEQQVAALTAENERLKAEWSIMARACGNWREWPEGAVSKDAPDYTHSDWQVAARAILERDQWKQMAEQLEVKIKKLKDELAEETWKRR
jgi:regulator of replication initiation timing